MTRPGRRSLAALLLAGLVSGCSSSSAPATTAARPASATPSPSRAAEPTLWLCRPGMARNPCEGSLATTVIAPNGSRRTEPFHPAIAPKIDCFYAYPTVSRATTVNAPLASAPEIVSTARAQASLFASVCRLYVPVYRQITTRGLTTGGFLNPAAQQLALQSLTDAWHDYLAHDNAGRGVVLLGHSQGAIALAQLIATEIDKNPAVRRKLVSALLLGGQVTTAEGKDTGGSFSVIPACRRPGETGCVVGYSSFASEPPSGALFGRTTPGRQVLCTDPGRLAGGTTLLHPYLPADRVGGRSGFVAYPASITGACHHADGASWLQIARVPGSRIPPQPAELGPDWGLHVGDVNLALGDLIEVVRRQAAAWR